ncbi:CLUMA_CG002422, isoform A [Clunio marinus]|uniref:CLUMA_CG002422, isoform A n=1 Tax=Clunio marinus TaxID=568069 RepID=A0A1J1HMF7_9DIPT|nr:CLUMA_CG002422, isoform A [Clunio marinus]
MKIAKLLRLISEHVLIDVVLIIKSTSYKLKFDSKKLLSYHFRALKRYFLNVILFSACDGMLGTYRNQDLFQSDIFSSNL